MISSYIKMPSDANFFMTFMLFMMMLTPAFASEVGFTQELDGFYMSKDDVEHIVLVETKVKDSKEVSLIITHFQEERTQSEEHTNRTKMTQIMTDKGITMNGYSVIRNTHFESDHATLIVDLYGEKEDKIFECRKLPKWVNPEHLKEGKAIIIKKLAKYLYVTNPVDQTRESFENYAGIRKPKAIENNPETIENETAPKDDSDEKLDENGCTMSKPQIYLLVSILIIFFVGILIFYLYHKSSSGGNMGEAIDFDNSDKENVIEILPKKRSVKKSKSKAASKLHKYEEKQTKKDSSDSHVSEEQQQADDTSDSHDFEEKEKNDSVVNSVNLNTTEDFSQN